MFGIGVMELLIVLVVGGIACAALGTVIAAAIKILRLPGPPDDPRR